jgi:hypothetical protein
MSFIVEESVTYAVRAKPMRVMERPAAYSFTDYFEEQVLRKRPYLQREWCIRVVQSPERVERQADGRWRFWARVPELEGRPLRVITLDDWTTIHNAFPDRGFNR